MIRGILIALAFATTGWSAVACSYPEPDSEFDTAETLYDALQSGDHTTVANAIFGALPGFEAKAAAFAKTVDQQLGNKGFPGCTVLMTRHHSPVFKTQMAHFLRADQEIFTFTYLSLHNGRWRIHQFNFNNDIEEIYHRFR